MEVVKEASAIILIDDNVAGTVYMDLKARNI